MGVGGAVLREWQILKYRGIKSSAFWKEQCGQRRAMLALLSVFPESGIEAVSSTLQHKGSPM